MPNQSCFVIMPIGDQEYGNIKISAQELKRRYTDLIREAIQKARPDFTVTRADDVYTPGGITTDIFTRLMHSDYVVADLTYPNPNVFYELGIRHACKCGTILIRGNDGPRVPFDLAGQRHITYDNTATGLKELGQHLVNQFTWFDEHALVPDNDFQKLAQLTKYAFPAYRNPEPGFVDDLTHALEGVVQDPQMEAFLRKVAGGEPLSPEEKRAANAILLGNPKHLRAFVQAMLASGKFPF